MPVPDFESVLSPLLTLFADGEPRHMADVIESIANHFNLTSAERNETLATGTRRIASNVGWARTDLGKAGLLERVTRGTWKITDAGRQLLSEDHDRLTRRYLSGRYPSHAAYTRKVAPTAPTAAPTAATATIQTQGSALAVTETPEETINRAQETLQATLADDLLERIKANSPAFFERLVIDLLLAMGYGGSRSDAGQVLGRSGDAGIDGVINEDRLGLDSIYVQAKRWEGVVGRPIVQSFVGSMLGRQAASKGILLTTSTFSQEAQQYARSLNMRVILIEHGVGITVVRTFQIKRIDSDYFDEA